ncbi:MAG: ribbon-helix-helix domain-containing protein [Candidatus Aenigmatarchaeota archaeon]
MTQVQVRLPEKEVEVLDKWVKEKRFRSRSDAIKSILEFYEEREKTREFYKMLKGRSEEAGDEENLIPLEEVE